MLASIKTCRACGRTFTAGEIFCPADGSRLLTQSRGDTALDPLIGSTLDGRYRILRVLGEGGMGIVYEGEHTLIERRVAVKVLREDFCRRADVVERFRREAKSASRIGHPNIVDVLDFGLTPNGASYFVMEMLHGEDLADVLARGGALRPERAVLIAYQCCHALAAAHDKGIIHRDLKPENIFLIEREGVADFVKIVDFGVAKMTDLELEPAPASGGERQAKLTRTGMIFGTPEYMSPEQAAGLPPDHRVDIYALGITLYELLTGRVPFEGESFMSVLSKHANKPVPALREVRPLLEVSPALEAVVLRALCKPRAQRFQHMREVAAALLETPELPALPFRLSLPTPARASASSPPRAPALQLPPPAAAGVAAPPPAPSGSRVANDVELPVAPSAPARVRPPRPRRVQAIALAAGLVAAALLAVIYLAASRRSGAATVARDEGAALAPAARAAPELTRTARDPEQQPAVAENGEPPLDSGHRAGHHPTRRGERAHRRRQRGLRQHALHLRRSARRAALTAGPPWPARGHDHPAAARRHRAAPGPRCQVEQASAPQGRRSPRSPLSSAEIPPAPGRTHARTGTRTRNRSRPRPRSGYPR